MICPKGCTRDQTVLDVVHASYHMSYYEDPNTLVKKEVATVFVRPATVEIVQPLHNMFCNLL
eukprot:615677-Karenia_brevis.AAC.1